MTSVAGASRYLNAATVANLRGLSAQSPNLIGDSSVSLLSVGKNFSARGVGLSPNSRALANQFLNRSREVDNLYAYATGTSLSIEGLQTQILGLRASLPDSAIAENARGLTFDREA